MKRLLLVGLLLIGCAKSPTSLNKSVVALHLIKNHRTGTASGFFVSNNGLILTAAHCVRGISTISITTSDGLTFPATVIAVSTTNDLALIKIAQSHTPYLALAKHKIHLGDSIKAIGNPLGITGVCVRGIVAKLDGAETLLDLTTLPGMSGCPIIDKHGCVVGVCSKYVLFRAGAAHFGIMVSLDVVTDFLKQSLLAYDRYPK